MIPLLSIVVPVYKEEGNLAEFIAHVVPVLEGITPDFEIVFAMDPSPDRTEELILTLRQKDTRVKLI